MTREIQAINTLINHPENQLDWWAICYRSNVIVGIIPCTPDPRDTPQIALNQLFCDSITLIRFTNEAPQTELSDLELLCKLRADSSNLESPGPEHDDGPWAVNILDILVVGNNGAFTKATDRIA